MTVYRDFVINVQASGLPAYLQDAADWQWVPVASAPNELISAVLPNPLPFVAGYGTTGEMDAWVGGYVDQDRKELVRPSNGGHNAYLGNEVYAITLNAAAPKWARVNNPTSNANFTASGQRAYPTDPNADLMVDGRCPSLHSGAEIQWQDGRAWFTFQTSTAGQDNEQYFRGNWQIPVCTSWERATDTWRQHGKVHPDYFNHYGFGRSAALPSQKRAFGFTNRFDNWFSEIDTTPGVSESARVTRREATVSLGVSRAWAVGCDDLNIVVVGILNTDRIAILNRNVGVNSWTSVTAPHSFYWEEYGNNALTQGVFSWVPAGTSDPAQRSFTAQPVYHAATKSLLFFEANANTTGIVRRLQIPTTGGAFNPSPTTWAWSSIQTGNAPSGRSLGGQGTYGRFGMINDIGGGVSALVCHPPYQPASTFYPFAVAPVYVCKIPASF